MHRWLLVPLILLPAAAVRAQSATDPNYDARADGLVTGVRSQGGCGSCWCFGTMASIESTLLKQGNWSGGGEPDLSENHLNWHHGFDPITACQGGDYRMSTAYLARGSGPVLEIDAPYDYGTEPAEHLPVPYYVRDIEWYDTMAEIKTAVIAYGSVATCVSAWHKGPAGGWLNDAWWQDPNDTYAPNHSVCIVGWDDDWRTLAPGPGAWLCKNSWGASWNDDGFFGISYEDKHAGRHAEMGAVSVHNVVPAFHKRIYDHDYHGWCAEKSYAHAFNAFTAVEREKLSAVSFYTTADGVEYELRLYRRFEDGQLTGLAASRSGTIEFTGFHTIDLETPVAVMAGEPFYVYLHLSNGEQAIECTVTKEVLMDEAAAGYVVVSEAHRGESFFSLDGVAWSDLYDEQADHSANFCIKALATELLAGDLNCDDAVDFLDYFAMKANYGRGGATWAEGDTDADGDVDLLDYEYVRGSFGQWLAGLAGGAEPGGLAPEPATLALLGAGACLALLRRRR